MNEDMNKKSTNEGREKISAYLDDALPQVELDALSSMDVSAGIASRYQMIGEVLRGQMSDASMVDVRMQVHEALRNEDLEREDLKQEEMGRKKMDVPDIADQRSGQRAENSWAAMVQSVFGPAWHRPLGGLAVAASVAMIMVITVNYEETASTNGMVAESKFKNTPVVSVVASSSANETRTPDLINQRRVDQPRSYVNLDTYLAEHAEFAAQDTMQGRMPYARAVSYVAE